MLETSHKHLFIPLLQKYTLYHFSSFLIVGSVFKAGWRDCPDEWYQPSLADDFYVLREVRAICNKALNEARSRQVIRSFLAASTHLYTTSPKLASLISSVFPEDSTKQTPIHHHHSLSDFLLVSQASLSGTNEEDTAASRAEGMVDWPGEEEKCSVQVSVQVSSLHKCPRCWKHTSTKEDSPCERCSSVMEWMTSANCLLQNQLMRISNSNCIRCLHPRLDVF